MLLLVVGASGSGKSASVESLRSELPDVIVHNFDGAAWLRRHAVDPQWRKSTGPTG
jgi:ABC-type dipeptide/oligopeptide/nickel transport system ATPase component